MAETKPGLTDPEQQNQQIWRGFGKFFERITPALLELGVWIFGSLLAFNLLILASLIPIGPVDLAIKLATFAFALDLPINLMGLILLRLVKELKGAGLENQLVQAFQEEGFVSKQMPDPAQRETILAEMHKRRTAISVQVAWAIMALSLLVTFAGMLATLGYMAWWISASFFVAVILSLISTILILAKTQPRESK